MGIQTSVVKNKFGQYFKIELPQQFSTNVKIKAENFWNEQSTQQFIQNLTVPNGYWREMINQSSTLPSSCSMTTFEIEQKVSSLMMQGQLKLYPLELPDMVEHPPEKRVLKGSDDTLYRFTSLSTLLVSGPSETMSFSTIDEARTFIVKLNPTDEQVLTIANEMNLSLPVTSSVNSSEVIETISESLVSNDIVIIVDKVSSVPPSEKVINTEANNKNASEQTPPPIKEEVQKKIDHVCMLHSMKLSCKHGRTVILKPDEYIDKKTGMAKVYYLAVTSLPKDKPQKDQELLTAEIDIEDKCDSHTKAPFTITSDSAKLVNENFGKIIKFYSPGKELNLTTNFYKYLWLPSIKPLSYKVSPPKFCDMTEFEGKAKSIRVDVYPDIKWDIGLDIGFGQIKATDSSPGDKNKSSNNVIERKIEQEVFSITGKAKCTHGNDTLEFVSKLSNKFDVLKQEITDQNALLSKIFGKFEDGDNHSVTLDLPKLSFNGTSSIAENNGTPDVNVRWDYNIKAAPLIGMNAQVDVLPMLLKSSGWGSLFLPLLSELKEKYANPDGSVGVQLEASIILSIAGKVSFNMNFSDKSFPNDEKSELRTLKFDVPFKCTGELKGKGHLLIFAVELGVSAELSSGFAYEMFMGADSDGIYRSSILHFHGLIFEIKAYIEGKRKAPGKKKTKTGPRKKTSTSSNVKRQKMYNNKWTWIDKNKIEFNKNYVINN